MLIGEYSHSIDSKKRISVPSKLRKEIGQKAILTRGLDSCLFLFPAKEWDVLAQKLGALPFGEHDTRAFVRLMLSGASEVEIDPLGRILLPDYLRDYASLNREAIIAGLFNRLEIWDSRRWHEYKTTIEKNGDRIAQKLGEIGII